MRDRKMSKQLLNCEVAVYRGDDMIATGTLTEVAAQLKVNPETIYFYLTPAYQRRLAKRKTLDRSRTAVRLDDDDE